MSIPLPTGTFTVRRPGAPAQAGVAGHASYRGGADVRGVDQRQRQVGAWTLLLEPTAWPITEECLVDDDAGRTYRVHSAELRGGIPALAHVVVDADSTTADATGEGAVDAEGNVEEVPV